MGASRGMREGLPPEEIVNAHNRVDELMVSAINNMEPGAVPWEQSLNILALAMLKDELPERPVQGEDKVGMTVTLASNWLRNICRDAVDAAKEIKTGGHPLPELESIVERCAEMAYEFDEELSKEFDELRDSKFNRVHNEEEEERSLTPEPQPEEPPSEEVGTHTINEEAEKPSKQPIGSEIEKEAKRLYGLSNQGDWDDLDEAMQQIWMSGAEERLKEGI